MTEFGAERMRRRIAVKEVLIYIVFSATYGKENNWNSWIVMFTTRSVGIAGAAER